MALELNNSPRTRATLMATAIICAVLQVALAPQVSIFGGRFNFMLVLTISLAIAGDSRSLVYIGFLAGLFHDLTTASPVGLMALLLVLTGYLTSLMSRGLSPMPGMETVRTVAIAVIAVNALYALALFFMGVEHDLLMSIGARGLASSVLDVLACIPFLIARGQSRPGGLSSRARRGFGGSRYKGLR